METPGRDVRPGTPEDRDRLLDVVVAAFADDPLIRWFFPDDPRYDDDCRDFFGTLLDLRLRGGIVDVDDDGRGSAQWDPPGGIGIPEAEQDRAWAPHVANRSDRSQARFEAVGAAFEPHVPAGPHWYLGVLAVHPDHHRRGHGRRIASVGCTRADDDGLPCFLETATPGNLPFYEGLGFRVTHEVDDLPDAGPLVWLMTRPPHTSGRA